MRKVDDREKKEKKKRKLRDVEQEREVAIFKQVKCRQDKCCLDKYHVHSCLLLKRSQENYHYSLVKIG